MLARVLLAFLATAGFFYVNIMLALVDGLKVGLGFTNKQAGLVGSCNVYGAAAGAFLIAFLFLRINWRTAAHLFLLGLICMDLLSMLVKDPIALMGVDSCTVSSVGCSGHKLFNLCPYYGTRPDFWRAASGASFRWRAGRNELTAARAEIWYECFVCNVNFVQLDDSPDAKFLPDYPVKAPMQRMGAAPDRLQLKPLLLALLSVFFFQAANMGLFAFIIGLGRAADSRWLSSARRWRSRTGSPRSAQFW